MRSQSGHHDVLRWSVSVLLVWLVLRTWLLQGVVVPVRVAGGSMADTLMGPHRWVLCETCGHEFAVGSEQLPSSNRVTCGSCGQRTHDVMRLDEQPGQRMLIDRSAWLLVTPQRWEVVVIRCPDQAKKYCVKRVVGLPGELVQIRQGDIYINGEIARKDLIQQRAMAQRVHCCDTPLPAWRGEREPTQWRLGSEVYEHPVTDIRSERANSEPIDWLGYHPPGRGKVTDNISYNQSVSRRLNDVTDLMLSCLIKIEGSGQLYLSIPNGHDPFLVRIPNHRGKICLLRGDQLLAESWFDPGLLTSWTFLELSLFDSQLLLALDNKVRLRFAYDRSLEPPAPSSRSLAIGSRSLGIRLRALRIWRDIYYADRPTGRWRLERPYQLNRDDIFLLGDNSPISEDSRSWQSGGAVPMRLLIGRPWAAN